MSLDHVHIILPLASYVALSFACVQEDAAGLDPTEETIRNLIEAGYDVADISVRERPARVHDLRLSLDEDPAVVVQDDGVVTLEASRAMLDARNDEGFRLWRTPNSVDPNQTICMVPLRYLASDAASWSWALIGPLAYNALTLAVANYNAADISLTFSTRSGTVTSSGSITGSFSGCNAFIVVYSGNWLPGGVYGETEVPQGDGDPGGQIVLSPEIEGLLTADRKELIVTHEMGHALGLRHSDWKTGSSCFPDSPESKNGAVQIGGTVDQTEDSVMAACMPVFTDGELEAHDLAAIEALWPE